MPILHASKSLTRAIDLLVPSAHNHPEKMLSSPKSVNQRTQEAITTPPYRLDRNRRKRFNRSVLMRLRLKFQASTVGLNQNKTYGVGLQNGHGFGGG
jgi:hypothetical protein